MLGQLGSCCWVSPHFENCAADLWTTVDRASLNPPETEAWKFPGPNLHWDTSLVLPVLFGVQGILYLTHTAPHQRGLHSSGYQ